MTGFPPPFGTGAPPPSSFAMDVVDVTVDAADAALVDDEFEGQAKARAAITLRVLLAPPIIIVTFWFLVVFLFLRSN